MSVTPLTAGSAQPIATTGPRRPDGPRWCRPLLVRLLVFVVPLLLVLAITQGVISALGDPAGDTRQSATLLIGVGGAGLALLLYGWLVRWTERRSVDELVPRAAVGGLLRGAAVGLVLFSAVIGVLAAVGDYRISGTGPVSALVTGTGVMAASAVQEELLFRGALFRLTETRLGTWGALVLSAVLFGALHLANSQATVWGAMAVAVEAGVMLGAAYAATRTLWVPIGLHFAWNLAETAVYGTVSSGSTSEAPVSLFTAVVHGPSAVTGGDFGPEAGLPALAVCCVSAAVFLVIAARRGELRPSRLRRSGDGVGAAGGGLDASIAAKHTDG